MKPLLVVLFCGLGCARTSVEAGQTPSASCSNDAGCPSGFACNEGACQLKGFSAQSSDSLRAPTCQYCREDADCGDDGRTGCWIPNGVGTLAHCAFDCTTLGCPEGTVCQPDPQGDTKTCWPVSGACPPNPQDAVCNDADTYESFARSFFVKNCANCHSAMAAYAGVSGQLKAIRKEVASQGMPPRDKLSAETIAQLTTWIDCGAKQ